MKVKSARGNKRTFGKIADISQDTERGIRRAFYLLGKDLVAEARQLIIKGPKTGKLYRISGRKKKHRASSPGEAPANLSGNLQRSVNFLVQGSDSMKFGAYIEYGGFLELGTSKMEARPYLIKAIDSNERNAEFHFQRNIEREFR